MWLALDEVLVRSVLYNVLLKYGLQESRWDVSMLAAATMMSLRFLAYWLKLNFFHGSFLILQHLRGRLLCKYASLSARDRDANPTAEQDYRVAITYTAEEVREQCWKGTFHRGLPAAYRVGWSLVYLAFFSSAGSGLSLALTLTVVMLLVLEALFKFSRVAKGREIWLKGYALQRRAEQMASNMIHGWQTQKQSVDGVVGAYWAYIRGGPYVMWYHREWPAPLQARARCARSALGTLRSARGAREDEAARVCLSRRERRLLHHLAV
jgi:hypothetical protein